MLKPYYDIVSWYTYMVSILIYCTFDLSDVMNIANCRCGVCSEVGASQPRNQETVCWGQIFVWESEKFLHISEIADFNVFFSAISVPKSTNLLKSYPPAYENFYSFNCIQLKIRMQQGRIFFWFSIYSSSLAYEQVLLLNFWTSLLIVYSQRILQKASGALKNSEQEMHKLGKLDTKVNIQPVSSSTQRTEKTAVEDHTKVSIISVLLPTRFSFVAIKFFLLLSNRLISKID